MASTATPQASSPTAEPTFVTEGRARVETALRDSVRTIDPFLTEVASHLIVAGGKRQRPLFAMASSIAAIGTARPASDDAIAGGVAVELVHLGSLYHDDVIDEAPTRRTVESVNARWGNLTAILAGDFLLAKASEIAASLGTEVAGLLARTIGWLCEGEVLEIQAAFNAERTEAAYLESIKGKTASLFATACRIGGIVAELPRDQIESLTTFGEAYGMAFQIVDDVLDLVATEAELGKPAGHDLVEGVYTLPVLRAMAADPSGDLRGTLGSPIDEATLAEVLAVVRGGTSVAETIAEAQRFVDHGIAALAPFGDTDAARWLAHAAQQLLDSATAAASR